MSFDVTLTATHPSDPTPYVKTWTDLSVKQIGHLHKAMRDVLEKFQQTSERIAEGDRKGIPPSTSNGEMKVSYAITKDGQDGGGTTMRVPGLGSGNYSAAKGLLDGVLANVDREVKGKEKHGGHGDGGGRR